MMVSVLSFPDCQNMNKPLGSLLPPRLSCREFRHTFPTMMV